MNRTILIIYYNIKLGYNADEKNRFFTLSKIFTLTRFGPCNIKKSYYRGKAQNIERALIINAGKTGEF